MTDWTHFIIYSLADNPIVFASDGFVKVTGYTRSEIIPRNCRFLQGQHTDRVPVRRLKTAINERKESVELILNYKKNGDPFWNLLYVGESNYIYIPLKPLHETPAAASRSIINQVLLSSTQIHVHLKKPKRKLQKS